MKLYLSSYRVPTPNDLSELVGKPFTDMKIALISNAKDYYAPRARHIKTQKAIDFFADLGVRTINEIDLRKYDTAGDLEKDLDSYDLIWANGGNTFMLRYEMRRSGFDEAIRQLLERGATYGGESAGAIVAGTDLRGTEPADEPEFSEEIIWEGMGLVDTFVSVHIDNPQFADIMAAAGAMHGEGAVVSLKDSQALLVRHGERIVVE